MDIKIRNYSFVSHYDKVPIHGICMIPEHPIGILQMVHGMCEHKERFVPFMRNMAECGYITLMHDNRGHGGSVKEKGDIGYCYESAERGYVEDIYRVTKTIRQKYPDLPLILYGHSMGSLAARAYLRTHDDKIDGLIISGCPSYNDAVPFGMCLVQVMKTILGERYRSRTAQQMVLGSFERKFWKEHREYAWLAEEESVAEAFKQDKQCTFTYTLNGFETLLNLEYITYLTRKYQLKNPELPILFISGKEDPCYVNERKWTQAVQRMHNLGYRNITDIRYDGMRHEIHNEKEKERVFSDIDLFCKKVVKKCN